MKPNNSSSGKYPLYRWQKWKLYERLIYAFPISALRKKVKKEIEAKNLQNYREFLILVEVHKFAKVIEEALRDTDLYGNYVEKAFPVPHPWKEKKPPEPTRFGFLVEVIEQRSLYLPYWYQLSFIPSWTPVLVQTRKGKWRRMLDYSRTCQLKLEVLENPQKWLLDFVTAFFYCPVIHRFDPVKLEIRGETFSGETEILVEEIPTKVALQMPICVGVGFEEFPEDIKKKIEEIFSYDYLLELLAGQLKGKYPLAKCLSLTFVGEPIPRAKGVILDTAEDIKRFFQEERQRKTLPILPVEFYYSIDKRDTNMVDTLVLESDPPFRMTAAEEPIYWYQTLKDEERKLQILIQYGLKPESLEINFSGNKSLHEKIHINPSITHQEAKNIQAVGACIHKFEAAEDSYMYTLDRSGLARVTKEALHYLYAKKQKIKCVPVPNILRPPIHLSIPLRFSIKDGQIKFDPELFNLHRVRELSKWENVKEQLLKEEKTSMPMRERLFKPQSYYEKHATPPDVFRNVMKEFPSYKTAIEEIPPLYLDRWRKEWIKERFA